MKELKARVGKKANSREGKRGGEAKPFRPWKKE